MSYINTTLTEDQYEMYKNLYSLDIVPEIVSRQYENGMYNLVIDKYYTTYENYSRKLLGEYNIYTALDILEPVHKVIDSMIDKMHNVGVLHSYLEMRI